MNIIPPSYKFKGNIENSRMAKSIGLKFYYDVANRLVSEGLPSLSVNGVLSDGLVISISAYKNSVNDNISGTVDIYTPTKKKEEELYKSNIDIIILDYSADNTFVATYNNGVFEIVESNIYYGLGSLYPKVGVGSWTNNKDLVCNFNSSFIYVHDKTLNIGSTLTGKTMIPAACITSYNNGNITGFFIAEAWSSGEYSVHSFSYISGTLTSEEIYTGISSTCSSFIFGNTSTSFVLNIYYIIDEISLSKLTGTFDSGSWSFSNMTLETISPPTYKTEVETGSNHVYVTAGTNYAGNISNTFNSVDIVKVDITSDELSTETRSGGGSFSHTTSGGTGPGGTDRTETYSGSYSHSGTSGSFSSKSELIWNHLNTSNIPIVDTYTTGTSNYTQDGAIDGSVYWPLPPDPNVYPSGSGGAESLYITYNYSGSAKYTVTPLFSDGSVLLTGVSCLNLNGYTENTDNVLTCGTSNIVGPDGTRVQTTVTAAKVTYKDNNYKLFFNNSNAYNTNLTSIVSSIPSNTSTLSMSDSMLWDGHEAWNNPNVVAPVTPDSSSTNYFAYSPGDQALGKHYVYTPKMYAVKIPPITHGSSQTDGVIVFFEVINNVVTSNILGTYPYSSIAFIGLNIYRKQ